MSDFLAENNLCGQTILRIVSRGNHILSDLFKLKDYIPQIFKLENKLDIAKYGELICDFKYSSIAQQFEENIERNPKLQELDDEIRENYLELLTRFYNLFESIYKYISNLNQFLDDVKTGLYIQMNFETLLSSVEGKQILAESVYLYGIMLLEVDHYIEGTIRERLLTSYYRYSGGNQSDTNVDDVCKLLRSTGLTKLKKPLNYPELYFRRISLNETFLKILVGRLRTDDIYNQLGYYPLPEHRSVAYSNQSSILVLVLYFCPNLLHSENAMMREISDKFFSDNWVISIYMDFYINLVDGWSDFKAAKQGLQNTIEVSNIKNIASKNCSKIPILIEGMEKLLKEGIISEENILERATKVINLLRDCNVVLKWMILHTAPLLRGNDLNNKKCKQLRDLILTDAKFDSMKVLTLLLYTSQLEIKVKDLIRKLLDEKIQNWNKYKNEAKDRVSELSEVFNGNKPLSRIEKNEKLSSWLEKKANQIEALNFDEILDSGRKTIELIRAFDEVMEFHGLENQVQVKVQVSETTNYLHLMLRTGDVNESLLVTLSIVGNLGYAWGSIIDSYTPQMQELIKKDPFAVIKLRAVFLKLSSVMDIPLMRLAQAKSPELVSVSSFYSSELLVYVQKVLQIIPESVFSLLHQIIDIQTNSIKEIPTRLEKDKVKEYSQLEDRHKVSRLTHDMSILTEGILMMQTTLMGVIRVDPKKLLENGIRKELVRQVSESLNNTLIFKVGEGKDKDLVFLRKLNSIAQLMNGIKRSFEYIGDYVNSYGLKIFQEEFSRVINFTTEQECNLFKRNKILHFQSIYQSREIPIPIFISDDDPTSLTFMGRLVNEIISITNPITSPKPKVGTLYLPSRRAWCDSKTHSPIIMPQHFALMEKAIDISGLNGVDKILGFIIQDILQRTIKSFEIELSEKSSTEFTRLLEAELSPRTKIINMPIKAYNGWATKLIKNVNAFQLFFRVGQLQLIRKRIQYQLKVSANFNAKQLYSNVSIANSLYCLELSKNKEEPKDDNPLILDLLSLSEPLGIYNPISKIYVIQKPIPSLPLYLALLTIQQLQKLCYNKNLGILTSRKISDSIDIYPVCASITTLLMQFNEECSFNYFSYLCQYMNSIFVYLSHSVQNPTKESLQDLICIYFFLNMSCDLSPRKENVIKWIHQLVPSYDSVCNIISAMNT